MAVAKQVLGQTEKKKKKNSIYRFKNLANLLRNGYEQLQRNEHRCTQGAGGRWEGGKFGKV
jgi:hypothetical protein